MRQLAALALALALPAAAQAQAPVPPGEPETITSEAIYDRDDPTVRHFVEGYLEPEGGSADFQYARWKKPVCPRVIGLKPVAARLIESRIRKIAAQVGAPVDRSDTCRINIVAIFSDMPQDWLDTIAQERWEYVSDSSLRLTMKYPIQSWYTEMIRGRDGRLVWDEDHSGQACHQITRLETDCTMEFGFATTIIDTRAVKGVTLDSMADYLALVALSQTRQNERCQNAPSVANLVLKDCPAGTHVTALSEVDVAMLTGLYHMPDDRLQVLQRSLLVRAAKDTLRREPAP